VAGIIERAPWLAEPLTRLHALRFSDGSKSLKGFRKSFRDSPADLAEIKKLAMDPNALEIVAATLRESTAGIATDLQVLLQPWETYLAGIEAPIHFVHGEADTVSPLAVIEDLIRTLPHARLHVFRNRGNLFALRSLSDALSIATAA
jgi:pimeloyl-ACP methyl ester carboxylesterase